VWQVLSFGSSYSERPFERVLRPLVRWMDSLHKLPHKHLTEDEGKNNCQPPRVIALTKRTFSAEKTSIASIRARRAGPLSTLLRVYSFRVNSERAAEKCVLVTESGRYRLEDRMQKGEDKPVRTQIFSGEISSGELQQLRELLDAPAIAKMRHHEPPGGRVVIMGDILDLTIARHGGEQKLFLSEGYGHQVGAFFGGDGSLGTAQPLMKFLAEHVENSSTATALERTARNNCAEP
jgi:hypothetical protein